MAAIIKDRNGRIQTIDPPREASKKKTFKVHSSVEMLHNLDGSVSAADIPLGYTEQVKNSRLSKKLNKTKGHANPRKGMKGVCKSDFVPYAIAKATGQNLLNGKNPIIGFYILFSIDTGLRTSDIQNIIYSDLVGKRAGDLLRIQEKKTKKTRDIRLTNSIVDSFAVLYKWYLKQNDGKFTDDFIFLSQKKMIYTTYSLNRILKKIFGGIVAGNISTHSMRKAFGREFYNRANAKGLDGLTKLNELYGHASHAVTRGYLGLTRQEIADSYALMDD